MTRFSSSSPERSSGDLRALYEKFSASDYLNHFYSGEEPPGDEQCILSWLAATLKRDGRTYRRAIEVGCGPTLHHALPLVPYIESLCLADYSLESLATIEAFRSHPEKAVAAWSARARLVLRQEGASTDEQAASDRIRQLCNRVTSVQRIDLLKRSPKSMRRQFDLVTAFYTLENATNKKENWSTVLSHFIELCAPGGKVLLVAAIESDGYEFKGSRFSSAFLTKSDFEQHLPPLGFPAEGFLATEVSVTGWEAEGIQRLALVEAMRAEHAEFSTDQRINGETEKRRNGETEKRRNGETEKRRNGETEKRRNGETEK